MLSIVLLYLLAVVDFGCCGYRAAGGRLATLDKRAYFTDAIIRGVLFGHIILAIMVCALAFSFGMELDKASLWSDIQRSAQAALLVYIPYATLTAIAMFMRVVPSVDLKSIACTVLLGPLLFLRLVVAAVGIVYAAYVSPRPAIIAVAFLVMVLMLVFERLVERWYERQTI